MTSQRETKQEQKATWYKVREGGRDYRDVRLTVLSFQQSYEEASRCFDEAISGHGAAKEERTHSALLIVNELLRIANLDGEVWKGYDLAWRIWES